MGDIMQSFTVISKSICLDADDCVDPGHESQPCHCRVGKCLDNSCCNYATLTECTLKKCKNDDCRNSQIQRNQPAKLEVLKAGKKGHGLFTKEDIKRGQFLMEFTGEVVSASELGRRMQASAHMQHLYLMELKHNSFLDCRHKGSIGRFINHSCEPNCTIDVWTVGKRLRPAIFAIRDIKAGKWV
jgi:[histone H3]-lysine36 N-trimethyltransferase